MVTFKHNPPIDLIDLKTKNIDGRRYYITPDGQKLPSVTSVLGAKPKPHLFEWKKRVGEEEANRITRKSASRGTALHKICEDYLLNNDKHLVGKMPDAIEMFKSIKPILDKNITEVWYQEQALYGYKVGMAGRCDFLGKWNDEPAIVDFKNSRWIKTKEDIVDYFVQCTAYALMFEEMTSIQINKIVVVMAVENENPLTFIEKPRDYIEELVKSIKYFKNKEKK